ncbi:MAG TPA: gamma carbonic anhydrase family protein [Gammaproteobacteria bacterium]|nr:gamma carbonic anhydrase family protein [Gammaproteobacteria bacterium]
MGIRTFQNCSPKFGNAVFVDTRATVIGDVDIGDNASIWPNTVLRGDLLRITIGKNTNIQDGSVGHTTHASGFNLKGNALFVGDNVTVGHHALLHGCTIQNNVLIGMQSIILDGAIIESNIILGAGSLVSPGKHLQGGYLYFGRPAKMQRLLTEEEVKMIQYSAESYVKLKKTYLGK